MNLIKAVVVGEHKDYMDLLQRRVGGILKGIALTSTCFIDKVDQTDALLYICYAFGEQLNTMKEKFKCTNRHVLGVELSLMPAGIRCLRMLPGDLKLGVVAQHRQCANYFLSEIVRSGVMENRFFTGTFAEMKDMQVDKFVVPEEMSSVVDIRQIRQQVILIPRSISTSSAAEIINTAHKLILS